MEILTWCLLGVLLAAMLVNSFFVYQVRRDMKSISQRLDRIENQVEALTDVVIVMAYLAAKGRQPELADNLGERAIKSARRLPEAEKEASRKAWVSGQEGEPGHQGIRGKG